MRYVLLILALTSIACQKPEPPPPAPPIVSAVPADELNAAARLLAGVSMGNPLESSAGWSEWSAESGRLWIDAVRGQLDPVGVFQRIELQLSPRSVFYPFSGPDVHHLLRFYPGATTYVMAGPDALGKAPAVSAATLPAALKTWRAFFAAGDMTRGYPGMTETLLVLLARGGNTIDTLRFGSFTAAAKFEPGENPSVVEIRFRPADNRLRTLYYLSSGLSGDLNIPFLTGLKPFATLIKSSGRPLGSQEYAGLRTLVMSNSLAILQDETGIPFAQLPPADWNTTVFGSYEVPDAATRPRPRPLGFSIDYGSARRSAGMLLARHRQTATSQPASVRQ